MQKKTRIELSDNDLEKVTGGNDVYIIKGDDGEFEVVDFHTEKVICGGFSSYDEAFNWTEDNNHNIVIKG